MKVLFLYGPNSRNSGGLYNSVRNLGQSLVKIYGVDATALTFDDEYSQEDLPTYAPLSVQSYHVKGSKKFGFSLDIKGMIEEINPDILHPQCLWTFPSYRTLSYHKKTKKPYLISPRGMLDQWIIKSNTWKKKLALYFFETEHLKNAACLHALTMTEYETMRNFGCTNPVAIIPNGVTLPEENWPEHAEIPAWKATDSRKTLLFMSRLHPKKGLENLMEAWAALGSEKKEWNLVIAGESNDNFYYNKLISLQKKLKLEKDILFVGPQFHADKDICFRCADAFILPSFSEGLPMAVLEAWGYKLPVIITEACNIPEGFAKQAALKIAPEVNSILNGLNLLFNMQEDKRKAMGLNGYDLVNEKYIWASVAKQMLAVYNWVLNGGTPPETVLFN